MGTIDNYNESAWSWTEGIIEDWGTFKYYAMGGQQISGPDPVADADYDTLGARNTAIQGMDYGYQPDWMYVSQQFGDDGNDGSINHPKKTIANAISFPPDKT